MAWTLDNPIPNWEQVGVAVLMDIRDELQALNRVLHCPNFMAIPGKLADIEQNTAKRKRKKPK